MSEIADNERMDTGEIEFWFDGDFSEAYYAWGHVDREEFHRLMAEDAEESKDIPLDAIEYRMAYPIDEERFTFAPIDDVEPKPITMCYPF